MNMVFAMMAPQGGGQGNPLGAFLPLVFIMVIFYFLLIRPQQKRQKDTEKMREALKKNDRVITSGGIFGTIVGVKEHTITLKIADNVKIEISKAAISGLAQDPNAAKEKE